MENLILFVGYQSVGTLGRLIADGAGKVKILGDDVIVRAEVDTLPGVSGHADKEGLINWLKGFETKPRMVFVNHGDPDSADSFVDCLTKEFGYKAYAPYSGTSYDLLSGDFVTETEGKPIEKKAPTQTRQTSPSYTALMQAVEKLSRISRSLEGRANKELNRYTEQINSIIEKMEE